MAPGFRPVCATPSFWGPNGETSTLTRPPLAKRKPSERGRDQPCGQRDYWREHQRVLKRAIARARRDHILNHPGRQHADARRRRDTHRLGTVSRFRAQSQYRPARRKWYGVDATHRGHVERNAPSYTQPSADDQGRRQHHRINHHEDGRNDPPAAALRQRATKLRGSAALRAGRRLIKARKVIKASRAGHRAIVDPIRHRQEGRCHHGMQLLCVSVLDANPLGGWRGWGAGGVAASVRPPAPHSRVTPAPRSDPPHVLCPTRQAVALSRALPGKEGAKQSTRAASRARQSVSFNRGPRWVWGRGPCEHSPSPSPPPAPAPQKHSPINPEPKKTAPAQSIEPGPRVFTSPQLSSSSLRASVPLW